jgi:hypothetical protein
MLAGTAALCSLVGLNTKSATIIAPALASLRKLHVLAVRPAMVKLMPGASDVAREHAINTGSFFYEELSNLPPALGESEMRMAG